MKKIPIGIEDFKMLITDDYFYIDKSKFIEEILNDGALVNFSLVLEDLGKLLIMSMLKNFLILEEQKKIRNYLTAYI